MLSALGVLTRKVCWSIPACRATYHYSSRRPGMRLWGSVFASHRTPMC